MWKEPYEISCLVLALFCQKHFQALLIVIIFSFTPCLNHKTCKCPVPSSLLAICSPNSFSMRLFIRMILLLIWWRATLNRSSLRAKSFGNNPGLPASKSKRRISRSIVGDILHFSGGSNPPVYPVPTFWTMQNPAVWFLVGSEPFRVWGRAALNLGLNSWKR